MLLKSENMVMLIDAKGVRYAKDVRYAKGVRFAIGLPICDVVKVTIVNSCTNIILFID